MVGGQPVLPATAAAGWMVQLCEDLLPGYWLETLADFRVLKGVVFDAGEQRRFIAELRPVAEAGGNGDRHTLEVSIFNQVDGAALNRYQARVTMSRLAAEAPLDGRRRRRARRWSMRRCTATCATAPGCSMARPSVACSPCSVSTVRVCKPAGG